jgi:hypothetical protein
MRGRLPSMVWTEVILMSDRPIGPSRTCLDVLRQELRHGLACAAMATESSGDPATGEHHRENAEASYYNALRLVAKLLMSDDEMLDIISDLRRLRDALAAMPD